MLGKHPIETPLRRGFVAKRPLQPLKLRTHERRQWVVIIRSHEQLGRCLLSLSCNQSAESRSHENVKCA